MANRATVYYGPRKAFDEFVDEEIDSGAERVSFLYLIRTYNKLIRASDLASGGPKINRPEKVDVCVVHSDDYGSVVSHVISNFSSVLEEACDIENLYVQNPPQRVLESLRASQAEGTLLFEHYPYRPIEKRMLPDIYRALRKAVLGQERGKRAIITSLYRLSVMRSDKPAVVLLYGPSGVGKTETARALSLAVGGELMRVQFSMMQTQEAYEYLFGAEHSKASFARDLLSRESNIVLIDEFDKVSTGLYNMFYQLFDEGIFEDTNYTVDARNVLFILTSNFPSEEKARRALGNAMFSRISAFVKFDDLSAEDKRTIAKRHFSKIADKLDACDRTTIDESDIEEWFDLHANDYNNMRVMKSMIEKAIFTKLSEPIFSEVEDSLNKKPGEE